MRKNMSVPSHRRSQRITDLLLIPVSIATVITGFGLHVAGHDSPHEVWEQWAAAHVVATILFLVLGILHIRHHLAWYKSLFSKGLGKKSRITLLLTIAFLLLVITGIVLIVAIDGPNSTMGHLHYIFGLLLTFLSFWHIAKRWKALVRKGKSTSTVSSSRRPA